jgi:hypothetical protein
VPTWATTRRFQRDWATLGIGEKDAFKTALTKFIADLRRGKGFRPSLCVKGVQGATGIFEMTWANDGRATFEYGPAKKNDEPHVIWRRCEATRS